MELSSNQLENTRNPRNESPDRLSPLTKPTQPDTRESFEQLKPPKLSPEAPSSLSSQHPKLDGLPASIRLLVEKALSAEYYEHVSDAVLDLVKIGGFDAAKAISYILSEATSDQGALANLSLGGRHVTVYSLCKALLKLAGASRISLIRDVEPQVQLTRSEKKEVWELVRSLARGNHGDVETATGARSVFFERFADIPGVGKALDLVLKASMWIDGAPSGGPPRLLFVMHDLPWAFRSKLGFASVESRKGNLAEIFYRGKIPTP